MDLFRGNAGLFFLLSIVFILVVGGLFATWMRFTGTRSRATVLNMTADPYRIACLRGGEAEAVLVAVFNLLDRGFLESNGTSLRTTRADSATFLQRALDRSIVQVCAVSTAPRALLRDVKVNAAAGGYALYLAEQGLFIDDAQRRARSVVRYFVLAVVAGLVLTRLVLADRMGLFEALFAIVPVALAAAILYKTAARRPTGAGIDMIQSLQKLMERLRDRAITLRRGGESNEALLAAAVFGLAVLPDENFPSLAALRPSRRSSDGGGGDGINLSTQTCGTSASGCSQQQLWQRRRVRGRRMRERLMADRVGIGWRGELSAAILDRLDALDLIEVIAEDWIHASRSHRKALRALACARPVVLHGVSMGLASSVPVEEKRLERMARLLDAVRPEAWSEHLAFVRGGGREIGHLAAPPRSPRTVEGTLANLQRAAATTGCMPAMENIASLIEPPASAFDEPQWTRAIVQGAGAPLLLDLHNLYANAVNFGEDPARLLLAMPLESVRFVHLSGGVWVREAGAAPRLLDDHMHDVPDPVFGLLELLASRAPQPLSIIIERDGRFPAFESILREVERARACLAAGRSAVRAAAREAA